MSRNLTRRTALLGTVTLPAAMAPLAAMANVPSTAHSGAESNATDAAWAEYQAAKAAYDANVAAYDAWEAENVPERLHWGNGPAAFDYPDGGWKAELDAWMRERRAYRNPYDIDDDQLGAFCNAISEPQFAILETPAATVTDVERKLTIVSDLATDNRIEAEWIEGVLADVRRINGRAI